MSLSTSLRPEPESLARRSLDTEASSARREASSARIASSGESLARLWLEEAVPESAEDPTSARTVSEGLVAWYCQPQAGLPRRNAIDRLDKFVNFPLTSAMRRSSSSIRSSWRWCASMSCAMCARARGIGRLYHHQRRSVELPLNLPS